MVKALGTFITLITAIPFCSWLFWQQCKEFQVWNHGTLKLATIIRDPVMHKKYSHMTVRLDGGIYRVNVTSTEYYDDVFCIGGAVPVLVHPDYDIALRKYENPIKDLVFLSLVQLLLGYTAWQFFKGDKKPPLKKKKKKSRSRKHHSRRKEPPAKA